MGEPVNATPRTVNELYANLMKLHENRKHIDSMKVDIASNKIICDLDWLANGPGKTPDFFIPIKPAKIQEARVLVERFMSSSKIAPTLSEADQLFKLVDTNG